jgi:hypothetical protein
MQGFDAIPLLPPSSIIYYLVGLHHLLLGHHHATELVKVHRPRSVLVDLLNDAVEVLFRQPRVKLGDNLSQLVGRDVAVGILVVDSEGLLQLGLHRVLVGLFNEELCTQLTELFKLDFTRAVLVNLLENLFELLFGRPGTRFINC